MKIGREIVRLIPIFLFFFAAFSLINMTQGLMMKEEGGSPFSMGQVVLIAVVVAKVFIIIDHLPFIDAFSKKPLICKVLWKTSLYSVAALSIRLIARHFHEQHIPWEQFWAIQIWFLVLFFLFVAFRELRIAVGTAKVRKMFFGF